MSITSKFAVIIWIRYEEHFDQLWAELRAAAHRDPEKDTEYDSGRVFAHWDCDSREIAESLARALRRFSDRPEIVFLRLADYRNEEGSITYKDTRFTEC